MLMSVVPQVPDGATVALVPRHSKHIHHDNHDYVAGESESFFIRFTPSEKTLRIFSPGLKPSTQYIFHGFCYSQTNLQLIITDQNYFLKIMYRKLPNCFENKGVKLVICGSNRFRREYVTLCMLWISNCGMGYGHVYTQSTTLNLIVAFNII